MVRSLKRKEEGTKYASRKVAERERDIRGREGWKSRKVNVLSEANLFA